MLPFPAVCHTMSPELHLHGAEWEQGELSKEKGNTNPDESQCLSEGLSRAENCSLKGKCDLQMLSEKHAVPLLSLITFFLLSLRESQHI